MQQGETGGDLGTGLYVRSDVDLRVAGTVPLVLQRTYRTNDERSRSFGVGANDNYDMFLVGDAATFSYVDLILPDGGRIHYVRKGAWTNINQVILEHSATPTPYLHSLLTWNGNGWNVRFRDGSLMQMSGCNSSSRPGQCGILAIKSATQTLLTMTRNPQGDLLRVAAPDNHWIELDYDLGHRIVRARDSQGRAVQYSYDPRGELVQVRRTNGALQRYGYDGANRLVRVAEPTGTRIQNSYDPAGRISLQTGNWRGSFQFHYTLDSTGKIRTTEVTEPDRSGVRTVFNADGYTIQSIHRIGKVWQASVQLERRPATNEVLRATVSCSAAGDSIVLSAPEWERVTAYSNRHQEDLVCLALLRDSASRQRAEMAMNSNAALPR